MPSYAVERTTAPSGEKTADRRDSIAYVIGLICSSDSAMTLAFVSNSLSTPSEHADANIVPSGDHDDCSTAAPPAALVTRFDATVCPDTTS